MATKSTNCIFSMKYQTVLIICIAVILHTIVANSSCHKYALMSLHICPNTFLHPFPAALPPPLSTCPWATWSQWAAWLQHSRRAP